ncbi:MAG: AsmA family protein, partial [Alphaproteobacteria bacterium]|nr:AsmA family protein [Alphaproteobacteria bacterium]
GWADGLLTLERASAELPGGSAAALAGTVAWSGALPEADLRLHATASDLRGVLDWLGVDLSGIAPGVLRRATATGRFSGSRAAFQLTGLDITVDNTRLRGGFAVLDRAVPGIGLRLDVDSLNLDAYRPAPDDRAEATPLAALRQLARRLPAWSQAVNANIDASFGALVVDDIAITDLAVIATLRNGRLDLHDLVAGSVEGAALALSGVVASLDPLDGLDLAVDLAIPDAAPFFRLLDRAPPVPPPWLGRLAADGRVAYDDRTLRLDLAGEAAGGRYEVSGHVAEPSGLPAFDLVVRLRHDDPGALLAPFAGDYRPAEPLGAVDLYAEIAGSPDDLAFEAVQGQLGPVSLAGAVTLDRRGERPHVAAELQAGAIALDRLLPAEPAWAAGRGPGAWSDRPVDLSRLARVDGTLALTAASLSRGPFTVAEPALRAALAGGTLTLERLTGRLFDGTFGLSGSLEVGPPRRAAAALDLVGARAGPALAAIGAGEAIAGDLNFGFDGTTQGASPADMVAGLSGEGVLSVRDGQVFALDLAALERIIADSPDAATALLALPDALSTGSTPFAALNATFAVEAGVATADGYRMVGEHGVATGDAAVDLGDWRLDAETSFGLYRFPEVPAIRIGLQGPLDAPRRTIGMEALQDFIRARYAAARAE